jgi:hypothetical protein
MLSKYFDRISCVSIPSREKLFNNLQVNIQQLGGNIEEFLIGRDYIDVPAPSNWTGRNAQSYNYLQCFTKIIQKAKEDNIENLLYMEDDACILPHFSSFLPVIMDNAPKDWHMINFGPHHHDFQGRLTTKYDFVAPFLFRCQLHLGLQAVAINNKMFDYLIELHTKSWIHEHPYIDVTIAHEFHKGQSIHGKLPCYGAFPYIVCERSGMSYNVGKELTIEPFELWKMSHQSI